MAYRFPHDHGLTLIAVAEHPEWKAGSDGHIYKRDRTRVPERPKEAGENRLRINCSVHGGYHDMARLIAESFLGCRGSWAVIHENGNAADNRPENLRWVPQAGSNSNCSGHRRLSLSQKYELHRLLESGMPKTRIADALGISPRCVRHHNKSCRCEFPNISSTLL